MSIWQTTGIGSLPFVDCSEAVEHACSAYTVPFYPQLVKHERYSKSSLPQMLQEAVPLSILNHFAKKSTLIHNSLRLSELWGNEILSHIESLPGILDFSKALHEVESPMFKLQVIGPKTAICLLEALSGQKIGSDVQRVIAVCLQIYSEHLRRQCKPGPKKTILIIDEPLSPNIESLKLFHLENTTVGLHCCGTFDLGQLVERLDNEYLSFDLTQHVINDSLHDQIAKIRKIGGLMLGIVDTTRGIVDIDECRKKWRQLQKSDETVSANTKVLPPFLTGSCGTGQKSIAFEKQLSNLLSNLSETV